MNICENCGNEHSGEYASGRFCEKKCARSFSTKNNREEINKKISITLGGNGTRQGEKKCLCCNKLLPPQRKFCSNKCQAKYEFDNWVLRSEQLGFFEGYHAGKTGGSISRIKKYFIQKNGRCCTICNSETWTGNPIPLILDHIDGKSNNFKINNLRIICPNCDALLPTYGGRNRGNGNRIHKVIIKGD